MKRLLRVLALVACAGWTAGCGEGGAENAPKVPTEAEKAAMMKQMDQMKNMSMPPGAKPGAGSPDSAKEEGAQDKAKDEPAEDSSTAGSGDEKKADE